MTGICKLCNRVEILKESHVIPDFYIRGLEYKSPTGSKRELQPFSIVLGADPEMEGGAKQRGYWKKILGIKEYLLCGACEQKFQTNESYIRNLLYGNTPSPLKKLSIGTSLNLGIAQYDIDGLLDAKKLIVDYKKLKLFQLSLLWRAGIAKGSFFKNVDLGEFHSARLQKLLHTENPGLDTDYACVMIDLQHNGNGYADWIEAPKRSKNGQVNYQFIVGGYMYLFTVSKQKSRPSAQCCSVKSSGEMIILVADAKKIIHSKAAVLHRLGRL
jgi:hypothetical protein